MVGTAARTLLLVRMLELELYHRMLESLALFELTPTQYMVLSLASDHASLSIADMARRFQIAPQSMNQTVAMLLRKRLIGRRESPAHKRILHIKVTAAGKRLLARCDAVIDQVEHSAFGDLAPRELSALRDLLGRALSRSRESKGLRQST